jgi:A/G-specific adenine glycosylase
MADSEPLVVEQALRPFGLRWRAQRLHELATTLVARHGGRVPREIEALLQLPGVGPYVASATLATLTGRAVLLTDTNTVRVAKRVAGLTVEGDTRRRKDVQTAITSLLNGPSRASDWLAVLDLAATVCTVRNPRCSSCPINRFCAYPDRPQIAQSWSPNLVSRSEHQHIGAPLIIPTR